MKKTSRKLLSMLLALVMVVSMMSMSALADESGYALTGYGTDVAGISITGPTVIDCDLEVTSVTLTSGNVSYTYTYNIVLAPGTADDAAVTATFTKASTAAQQCVISNVPAIQQPGYVASAASLSYATTLSEGTGTRTAYVHHNVVNQWGYLDTYVFNYSIASLSNPITDTGNTGLTLRFGDPAYPNTAPECYMGFAGSSGDYTAAYNGPLTGYNPDMLSLYVTSGASTITAMTGGANIHFLEYDSDGRITRDASTPSTAQLTSGAYTLKITGAGDLSITAAGKTATIHFSAPSPATADTSGRTPGNVNGYLIGMSQYAANTTWGSISTDGNNSLSDTTKLKGVNGYVSSGFSLGSLGGYVQYDFSSNPIQNLDTNPYGVDFVIYGNAFNGNPEAAAVQVYGKTSDGTWGWYELAGSLYYSSDAQRNQTVVYTVDSNGVNAGVGANEAAATVSQFKNSTGWFPVPSAMNHTATSGVNNSLTNSYVSTYNASKIVFNGVTSIPDSDTTAFYAFGYADVTPNGTPETYGEAVNPYETYSSEKTGGDGFDLSWAVDIATGEPVAISEAKYVRIYSAVLHDTGVFGETSPEICGIYKVVGSGTGAAVAPTITIDGEELSALVGDGVVATPTTISDNQQILTVTGLDNYSTEFALEVEGGTYVVMNGVATNSTDIVLGDGETLVQIISQSGTAEPFITLVKLSA